MPPDQFEKIAQAAISAAEAIKCPFAAFVDGLREIEAEISNRRQMAEEELERMERDADKEE